MSRMPLAVAALSAVLATGCAAGPHFAQPAPVREWNTTLDAARTAADSGRLAVAEHHLSQYALRHPGTPEAHESLYWRGLFQMASTSDTAARQMAIPTLEQYLAKPGGEHRTEAGVLLGAAKDRAELERQSEAKEREIAQVRAALGKAQERPAQATDAPDQPADRGLAQEVERLKSELARANQELERIRKRLAGQQP